VQTSLPPPLSSVSALIPSRLPPRPRYQQRLAQKPPSPEKVQAAKKKWKKSNRIARVGFFGISFAILTGSLAFSESGARVAWRTSEGMEWYYLAYLCKFIGMVFYVWLNKSDPGYIGTTPYVRAPPSFCVFFSILRITPPTFTDLSPTLTLLSPSSTSPQTTPSKLRSTGRLASAQISASPADRSSQSVPSTASCVAGALRVSTTTVLSSGPALAR
jgi:hypothetical protein